MTIIEVKQQRLDALLAIRAEKGTNPEIAREIHELQKQIWAHENQRSGNWPERCLSHQLFGKRIADMTKEEERIYCKVRAGAIKLDTLPHKPLSEWGDDELRAIAFAAAYSACLTRRLFGKSIKELTEEEKRQYLEALKVRGI